MQIIVRSVNDSATVVVDVPEENPTLDDLKRAIEDVEFIPKNLQRLSQDSCLLPAGLLQLVDADTVTLCLGLEGGMRAKWKKKRTRRLRRKRRKMRDRAR
jgi:small subunit ribosomal protein S27Ae